MKCDRWHALLPTSILSLRAAATAADPLPIESFTGHEATKAPVLSPDGRYLAVVASVGGRRAALVRDLRNEGQFVPVISADSSGMLDLEWCFWVNDTRLMCGFRGTTHVREDFFPGTKLVLVDADGKNLKESTGLMTAATTPFDAGIVERIASAPELVQVQTSMPFPGDDPFYVGHALFRVEIATGTMKQEDRGFRRNLGELHTDGLGNLRLADGGSRRSAGLQASSNNGDDWTKLKKVTEFAEGNPLTALRVSASTGRGYGYALQDGRKALWDFDLDDKAPPRVAFAHSRVDVGDILIDDYGALLGVSYETDRPHVQYVDGKLGAIMRAIDKALPDTSNRIASMSKDRSRLVIAAHSNVEAGRYYLYDAAKQKLTDIGSAYPELDRKRLARMTYVEYPARDGTRIPAYVTKPSDDATKLPLILMPHSGYQGRARWAFDMLTQFLVDQGYAVITMNYRGSAGYGAKWLEAGSQDWDGVVYEDTIDAARWAVEQGIADARRICILGQGFSGYTALTAAIRDPELFRCAVSIGGRTDSADYAAYVNSLDAGRFFVNRGKGESKDGSPLKLAKQTAIPVLMIHGTDDTRSPYSQSEEMAKALEVAGKPVKLVSIDKADDSFWRESERKILLLATSAFLDDYLNKRSD